MRVALLIALAACSRPVPPADDAGHYRTPAAWLCLPGRGDVCEQDITTTAIAADGTRTVQPAAREPSVDCFYVYPTVDLHLGAANHEDFDDNASIETATRAQVARYGQICKLYVPLYRQVTIGAYVRGGDRLREGLDLAYGDVKDSFRTYLAEYNHGRPIVLVGHSQGAEMVMRLVQDFFDDDPSLRARLVLALPIGGHLYAPSGARVGGTFQHVPVCASDDEAGCVIAYRSFREGASLPSPAPKLPPGDEELCVSPGDSLDATFARTSKLRGTDGIATPFVTYPGLYSAHCVAGPDGARALEIAETRPGPVDLGALKFRTALGTHILDLQIGQENLIRRVARAAAHVSVAR
ncbi:MAG TPA: DUF3089 domain-containing protein [Kofleriaceae bacterium]|jgi:hypothetical protein